MIASRRRCESSWRASSVDCSRDPGVRLGIRDRLRRVAGEDRHRLEVVGAELVDAELAERDDTDGSALVDHRHDEHRFVDIIGPLDREPAVIGQRIVDEERFAALGHHAGERARPDVDLERSRKSPSPSSRSVNATGSQTRSPSRPVDADVVILGERARLGDDGIGDRGTSVSRFSRAERSWIERMRAAWSATER